MITDRIIAVRGAGEKTFAIKLKHDAAFGPPSVRFTTTAGFNGCDTPEEVAIRNLADFSDHNQGVFELYLWPCAPWSIGQILVATAEHGCYTEAATA